MTIMFITFAFVLLIGAPIYVAIGGCGFLPLVLKILPLSPNVVPQATLDGMSNPLLVAIALFFISGALMQASGLADEILSFADAAVGHVYGGVGTATIVASAFFATLTGSALAGTIAIGTITVSGMITRGFPRPLAGAVAASGGALGALIPPSNPMIIYGVLSATSIGALFTAGIVPGLMVTATLAIVMILIGKKNNLIDQNKKFNLIYLFKTTWRCKWSLIAPFIILGSIYSGLCTPTEAAEIAVFYAMFYGFIIKRTLKFSTFFRAFRDGAVTASVMLVMAGVAGGFGRIITMYQLPQTVGKAIAVISTDPHIVLLMILIFLLFTGCFMETMSQVIILTPIFLPILTQLGVSPVMFGVLFVLMIEIGFLTPPVGGNLFVAVKLTGSSIMSISKAELPFIGCYLLWAVIYIFFPELVLWFPRLLGYTV